MWNEKKFDMAAKKLPKLYSQEKTPTEEQLVHIHLFTSNTDWWITEGDIKEDLLFGYCCLGGDWQNAEWGYASISELKSLKYSVDMVNANTGKKMASLPAQVDFDLHWSPKKFGEIDEIRKGKASLYGDISQVGVEAIEPIIEEPQEPIKEPLNVLCQADYPEWREGKY